VKPSLRRQLIQELKIGLMMAISRLIVKVLWTSSSQYPIYSTIIYDIQIQTVLIPTLIHVNTISYLWLLLILSLYLIVGIRYREQHCGYWWISWHMCTTECPPRYGCCSGVHLRWFRCCFQLLWQRSAMARIRLDYPFVNNKVFSTILRYPPPI